MAQLELAFSFSGIARASFFMIILDFAHMVLLLSLKLLCRCNAGFLVFGLACLNSMLSFLNHVVSSIQTSPICLTCTKFSSLIRHYHSDLLASVLMLVCREYFRNYIVCTQKFRLLRQTCLSWVVSGFTLALPDCVLSRFVIFERVPSRLSPALLTAYEINLDLRLSYMASLDPALSRQAWPLWRFIAL